MAKSLRRDKGNRTARFLAREDALDQLCETVSQGESLSELCTRRGLWWGMVWDWLQDDERWKRFARAETQRDALMLRQVLAEIHRLAMIDPGDLYDDDGKLRPIKDIPAPVRACIVSLESVEYFEGHGRAREHAGTIRKVKLTDKLRALELLGKQLDMFADKLNVGATESFEKLVRDSLKEPTPTPGIPRVVRN